MQEFKKLIFQSFSKETCYSKVKHLWSDENPTLGHCALVSALFYEKFGGDICKINVNGIAHYFNVFDEQIYDFTSEQFKSEIDYINYEIKNYENLFLNEEFKERYEMFKRKMEEQC